MNGEYLVEFIKPSHDVYEADPLTAMVGKLPCRERWEDGPVKATPCPIF